MTALMRKVEGASTEPLTDLYYSWSPSELVDNVELWMALCWITLDLLNYAKFIESA